MRLWADFHFFSFSSVSSPALSSELPINPKFCLLFCRALYHHVKPFCFVKSSELKSIRFCFQLLFHNFDLTHHQPPLIVSPRGKPFSTISFLHVFIQIWIWEGNSTLIAFFFTGEVPHTRFSNIRSVLNWELYGFASFSFYFPFPLLFISTLAATSKFYPTPIKYKSFYLR